MTPPAGSLASILVDLVAVAVVFELPVFFPVVALLSVAVDCLSPDVAVADGFEDPVIVTDAEVVCADADTVSEAFTESDFAVSEGDESVDEEVGSILLYQLSSKCQRIPQACYHSRHLAAFELAPSLHELMAAKAMPLRRICRERW